MLKIIALSAALVLVSGCKLAVIVVEGGEVQSVGSGTCVAAVPGATGTVCINEITDTSYSESFTAVPDPGWVFVKWNSGGGFFCADSTNPVCVVDNTGIAGNPVGEAVVASDATFYIMPIFEDQRVLGFTGAFDVANWTQTIGGNGSIDTSGAPAVVILYGSNEGSGNTRDVDFTMTAPADGVVTFNWEYSTSDLAQADPFGRLLNNAFVVLTYFLGPQNQSGSASVPVSAGDTFGFRQRAGDDCCGSGITTISNFKFAPTAGP